MSNETVLRKGLISLGGITVPYTPITSGTYNILSTDYFIDCTSGTFSVTLPTSVNITGKIAPSTAEVGAATAEFPSDKAKYKEEMPIARHR